MKKAAKSDDKEGAVLDLGSGTGIMDRDLNAAGHEVVGIDFSPEMLALAKKNAPGAEYYLHDFADGTLPGELAERRFRFIVFSYSLHLVPVAKRIAFLKKIIADNLEDHGLLLIGDVAFRNQVELEACRASAGNLWDDEANYPVFDELTAEIKGLVFQKVSFCAGIIAWAKKEHAVEESEGESHGTDDNGQTAPAIREYSPAEVDSWVRVRDIPGDTIASFGANFFQAIAPYEKEALANWSILENKLQHQFGGTFTNNDILTYRTQAVSTYVKSNSRLPADNKETEWASRLFAAVFIHNRFPGDRIDTNLYGLYFGLASDLKVIIRELKKAYGDDVQKIDADLQDPAGKPVAQVLTFGLVNRR